MKTQATILVVDDHAFVRESLTNLMNACEDLNVVASAESAEDAIEEAIRHRPDVLVMDIDMPGTEAFRAVRLITDQHPECRVLFLSAFTNDRYIQDALDCGALGYVTKSASQETVLTAIRSILEGGSYFSPQVRRRLVVDASGVRLQPTETRASTLTNRELEMLRYLARGLSKKEIASIAHVSVNTVENHTANIMRKLELHDRVELARYAIREGLVEP